MMKMKNHSSIAVGETDPIRIGQLVITDSCDVTSTRFIEREPDNKHAKEVVVFTIKGSQHYVYENQADFPAALAFHNARRNAARDIVYPKPRPTEVIAPAEPTVERPSLILPTHSIRPTSDDGK